MSFLIARTPSENSPSISPTQPGSYPLLRTLLLTIGDWAGEVADRTLAQSQAWLGVEPPLCTLDIGRWFVGNDTQTAAQTAIDQRYDELASQQLLQTLQTASYQLKSHDELLIWLVFHLTAEMRFTPDQLTTMLQTIADSAWRRLRVHTSLRVLFLAEPADEPQLDSWIAGLRTVSIGDFYLAGPVNQLHVRQVSRDWQQQAATALTTLLWSRLPSHNEEPEHWRVRSLGAVDWPSPRRLLERWLSLYRAHTLLQQICQTPQTVSATPMAAQANPPQRLFDALVSSLPPLPARMLWRNRRPGWHQVSQLNQTLTQLAEHNISQFQVKTRQARHHWLGEMLKRGSEVLHQHQNVRSGSTSELPQFTRWQQELVQFQTQLQESAITVDERLAALDKPLTAAHERTTATTQELTRLCADFPPPTWCGLLIACSQPWRWIGWAWHYLFTLPRLAQASLDAHAAQHQIGWQEANWHLLRQCYLAQLQDVRQQNAALAGLQTHLQQVAEEITTQLAAIEQQIPAPWTVQRLVTLFGKSPNSALAESLQTGMVDLPLLQWSTVEPVVLAERLAEVCGAVSSLLQEWSVSDCLFAAFITATTTQDAGSEVALASWLAGWLDLSLPLWPNPEQRPGAETGYWLCLPRSAPNAQVSPGLAWLRAWLATNPAWSEGEICHDGLVALRWVTLRSEFESLRRNYDDPPMA